MSNESLKYIGSKNISGVYQAIINLIPKIDNFIEVFGGSLFISKLLSSIAPGVKYYCNDLDHEVIDNNIFASALKSNLDFRQVIDNLGYCRSNSVIYFLDPPYIHVTRFNSTNYYNFEMSWGDHIDLFNIISASKNKIILIHPVCEFYDRLLGLGWNCKEIKIRYHTKTSIERIYYNYEVPDKLLTYQFLGENFTDRQRILRKKKRIGQKLLLLPEQERYAILEYLNSLL